MRRTIYWIVPSIVSMGLLAGCPNREVAEVDPTPAGEEKKDIPVSVNRAIDILFVVDNSGSMEDEQNSLAANFPNFINVLNNIEGGLPDVHLGVISTDLGTGPFAIPGCGGDGDGGRLQATPRGACVAPSDAYIVDVSDGNGGRIRNYDDSSASLSDVFSCIGRLGISGCGFEQTLESVRRALDNNASNTGFIRDDAFLAVILLTDEDDCSVQNTQMFGDPQAGINSPLGPLTSFRCFEFGVQCEPDEPRTSGARANCAPRENSQFMFNISEYVDFLRGLKSDPGLVIVAGIMGDKEPVSLFINADGDPELSPSCRINPGTPDEQTAAPAVRLSAFMDQFPGRNTSTTICDNDLSDALVLVATLLAQAIGNPCIESNIDVDPDNPGVQFNCQVSDVIIGPSGEQERETVLDQCSSQTPAEGEKPCWFLQPEPNCQQAGFPTGLALVVERPEGDPPPVGTHVIARCELGPTQ